MPEDKTATNDAPDILVIYKSNWSHPFINYMKNRMVQGYFRYGSMRKNKKGLLDCIGSMKKRLALYEKTGNDEILVDIANIAMVEFVNGSHPKKHFKSIDDGTHTHPQKRRS